MKKYIFILLLSITLLPILVQAEDKSIILKEISLNDKSNNVEEINPAIIEDNKLLVDFKMYEVGDYIEYKIKVKNDSRETVEVDQNSLISRVSYLKYAVDSQESIIRGGEEKEILLKITYHNKVEDGDFFSAKYINQDKIPLVFKSTSLINPETIRNVLPIILVISLMVGYSVYNKKKINLSKAMILLLLVGLIPFSTSALVEEILIEPNIMIRKVKPTHCTFDGELVQGAEYTNGQYTYRYMQEGTYLSWQNIESDGWGVMLTDKNSTEDVTSTLCSTINDKPLVSTQYMFNHSKTSKIDTSSFDTQEVVNMQAMFGDTSTLSDVDISYFDTSKVTDMTAMFWKGLGFTELDLSSFDTSNVTTMSTMFGYDTNLNEINISNFNTSQVTEMVAMFNGCSNLTSLDLSNFDTSKVTNMVAMVGDCTNLEKLDISNFDFSNYNPGGLMMSFSSGGFSSLNYLILDNVVFPQNMVHGLGGLGTVKTISLNNVDTSNVTDMQAMFLSCSSLTSLDLSGFNTTSVTNMNAMFYGCSSLISLDLSGFNTTSVTNMNSMFNGCSSLISLDLNNFDTSNVNNMGGMFYGCSSLISLDLSNFDTSNVTNMGGMVGGCTNLEKLDISNFDFSNYNQSGLMMSFSSGGFSSLNNFILDNVVFPQNMAHGLGGLGTVKTISLNNVDTSNVTDMQAMFLGCSSLTSLDLSGFNTTSVTNMNSMFNGCSSLTSLDLSGFNTTSVTNMNSMFNGCSSLISLDLNNFDTSNVVNMQDMFLSCSSLTTLDLSSFDTSHVTNMNNMFSGDTSLTTAYGRTQVDCNKFNNSSNKPNNVNFIVKP